MISPEYLERHMARVNGFEARFHIHFFNKRVLLEALDHTKENSERKKQYAVAGDSLLDYVLYDHLITNREYTKGKMDCIRRHLTSDSSLAEIGKGLGLREFIVFPRSATKEDKETSPTFYNDTVEALVYAIMKDQGLGTAYRFVVDHIISTIPEDAYGCPENGG